MQQYQTAWLSSPRASCSLPLPLHTAAGSRALASPGGPPQKGQLPEDRSSPFHVNRQLPGCPGRVRGLYREGLDFFWWIKSKYNSERRKRG